MRSRLGMVVAGLSVFLLIGCGSHIDSSGVSNSPTSVNPDNLVVKGQAVFDVDVSPATGELVAMAVTGPTPSASGSFPVTVTVSPSTIMTLNTSAFSVPTITSAILDFGTIALSALSDNNLVLCGTAGNQHCNTALIRMYTTGQNGAGLWNSSGAYGAPITAGISGGTLSTVGLGSANAAVLQTISLASSKNVVHLTDFTASNFDVKIDFSNAGVGSYQTTLVVEYDLSP